MIISVMSNLKLSEIPDFKCIQKYVIPQYFEIKKHYQKSELKPTHPNVSRGVI